MRVALTGGTGFIGRYMIDHLIRERGHTLNVWHRPQSDRSGLESLSDHIQWVEGSLGDAASCQRLVDGADAVVHSALYHPAGGFMGGEGDLLEFARVNILGTLQLMEAAWAAGVKRFVYISTCAVHDVILDDRPLDETHPLWPKSHYGAHKAALEKFVHSYGLGKGYEICALRPTGVYGLAHRPQDSKWFNLVAAVARGEAVECRRGGKEVHAADVAKAAGILLEADGITGQAYNCYDRYISEYDVATTAKRLSGSQSEIRGNQTQPKNQIETGKLRALGMQFGGDALFEQTVAQMLEAAR